MMWHSEMVNTMYFPLKDQNDIFRIGVAISDKPEGPFIPEQHPMKGSYRWIRLSAG